MEYHTLMRRTFRSSAQLRKCVFKLIHKSEDKKLQEKKKAAMINLSRIAKRNIMIAEPNVALWVLDQGLNLVDDPLLHALRACALLLAFRWADGRSLLLLHRDKIVDDVSWISIVFDQLHEVSSSPSMFVEAISMAEKVLEAVYPYSADVAALIRRDGPSKTRSR